ncbi:hypothetical protein EKM05_10710 [Flavobacterium sp. GSP27]|uniref:Uncharacterized protein n=1 Tax=Flavobacterium bomense TaxID=2497483 RepID=A0A432CL62_9FLAO|nr:MULTISPECIES: hypothetical protein [Flavobacterium]RTY91759.1 hypothetical protein EKL32_18865 [Flavobacterium sp. GSN2]RTY68962.1 hypothetical protein EKL95_07140 [Flavobacterium sp. LB2P53]RTY73838.1 hypothetical protein EKL96_10980 [Flavobacterium sp. LS1R10]RTY80780.1 hypothetical protein EKL97_09770 [Flavobacterium sp. LS1P28]RTY83841.1 hypothetical protein EKL99_04495 [Flavobacterium sp. ZB4P23]
MEKEYQFKLVEGQFAPSEAGKVLFSLINNKINYHNLEKFSNQIRFDEDCSHSKIRLETLLEASEYIKELIKEASSKDLELKIDSVIQIVLCPKVKTELNV